MNIDLQTGKRGSRLVHAELLLKQLTHAEAALVVNNNAAAVLLVLSALAHRRRVVISRTQLVEIGGGFRIPDVMQQSGAHLYESARPTGSTWQITPPQLKKPHLPWFYMRTAPIFASRVSPVSQRWLELAEISHHAGIPLVDDLGSGALLDTCCLWLGARAYGDTNHYQPELTWCVFPVINS